MEPDLHHPLPRLPEGWKPFQVDNIDVTTTGDMAILTGGGHHSRSASALSNHNGFNNIIQPSQIQNLHNNLGDSIYGEQASRGGGGGGQSEFMGTDQNTSQQYEQQRPDLSHFRHPSVEEYEYHANTQTRQSIGSSSSSNNTYFHLASTAPISTATGAESNTLIHNSANNSNNTTSTNTRDDPSFYDRSSSPFINPNPFTGSTTSPPIVQDTLSPFAPYHNSFDATQQHQQQQETTFDPYDLQDNNTLGPHYSHYRSLSEQSEISSNAPSPYIHSEQGSPFIAAQGDNSFTDDLLEGILGLDMGAPFDSVVGQYQNNHQNYDTTNLQLDQGGFPIDAPLFPSSSDRQEQEQQQQQQFYEQQQPSRPTSSHSYTRPPYPQSIFSPQLSNISTSIPPAFTSPPLGSAASIPEIEVTVAPPTPRTQAYFEYYPQPYPRQQQSSGSAQNSPSIQPSYLYNTQDLAPLSLPAAGRRRAVSDSGARPNFVSMMPPSSNNTTLVRRVSSGSHPYLGVHEGNGTSSGRSTPSRGYHRKSFSHGGHNMTAREVLDLVKNEGPREAKNPKKFICDFPGCGQRFTRNSNKT